MSCTLTRQWLALWTRLRTDGPTPSPLPLHPPTTNNIINRRLVETQPERAPAHFEYQWAHRADHRAAASAVFTHPSSRLNDRYIPRNAFGTAKWDDQENRPKWCAHTTNIRSHSLTRTHFKDILRSLHWTTFSLRVYGVWQHFAICMQSIGAIVGLRAFVCVCVCAVDIVYARLLTGAARPLFLLALPAGGELQIGTSSHRALLRSADPGLARNQEFWAERERGLTAPTNRLFLISTSRVRNARPFKCKPIPFVSRKTMRSIILRQTHSIGLERNYHSHTKSKWKSSELQYWSGGYASHTDGGDQSVRVNNRTCFRFVRCA